MDFWKVVKIIGFVLMVLGMVIFLIATIQYKTGKVKIKNGSSIEVLANMDHSEFRYITITYRRKSYRWGTQVTYEYE